MAYLRKGEAVHSMTNPSFTVFHRRRLFGCTKNYCLGIFNSYTTLKKQDKVNQNTTQNYSGRKLSEQTKNEQPLQQPPKSLVSPPIYQSYKKSHNLPISSQAMSLQRYSLHMKVRIQSQGNPLGFSKR